ncbi:MAG: hypothetical protein ACKESB_01835 [Candidatus Hodgkinia cicadicola]
MLKNWAPLASEEDSSSDLRVARLAEAVWSLCSVTTAWWVDISGYKRLANSAMGTVSSKKYNTAAYICLARCVPRPPHFLLSVML